LRPIADTEEAGGGAAPRSDDHPVSSDTTTRPVLIGFGEALAAPEVAWSLLDAGFPVAAVHRRGRRSSLRRCHSVEVWDITPPERDARAAARELGDLIRRREPALLMPLDDKAISLCAAVAGEEGTTIAGPTGAQAKFALDKRLQLEAATRAGFPVPATSSFAGIEDVLAADHPFPIMLKGALAIGERDGRLVIEPGRVCANRAELGRSARDFHPDQPLLAQQYLAGTGEGLFGLAQEGRVRQWSAHRRVRMENPQGSGSSACRSSPVDPASRERAERLVAAAGWTGLFMVELLRDDSGRAWFMEFNGRAWGSMALARRLGFEYPAWAAAAALDPAFTPSGPPWREGVTCRHLGRELVHLLLAMRGPRSRAIANWPSRARAFLDVARVRRDDEWYNLRPGQRELFAADTLHTLRAAIFRQP
jgi:predicted ATP-grasp superfamily ATP-dependent carboligase